MTCDTLRLTIPSEYRDIVNVAKSFSQKVWGLGFGVWCLLFGVWCLAFGLLCLDRTIVFLRASVVGSHMSHNFPAKSFRTSKFLTTNSLRTCKSRALRLRFCFCCFVLIEFKCFCFLPENIFIVREQACDTKRVRNNREMVMEFPLL